VIVGRVTSRDATPALTLFAHRIAGLGKPIMRMTCASSVRTFGDKL